jgi:hypothetical protein
MNNRTKLVIGATVALFVFWIILRFVVLSASGVYGVGTFYFALPIGGVVAILLLLVRLGLLNFRERPSTTLQHWPHNTAVQAPQPAPAEVPEWQRLQELDALWTNGAISETEYAERRAELISGI